MATMVTIVATVILVQAVVAKMKDGGQSWSENQTTMRNIVDIQARDIQYTLPMVRGRAPMKLTTKPTTPKTMVQVP